MLIKENGYYIQVENPDRKSLINNDIQIGYGCDIGSHVLINNNVYIHRYVKIESSEACRRTYIRSRVQIGEHVSIGSNTIIEEGTRIQSFAKIGDNVRIGKHVKINASACICDDAVIADNAVIAKGEVIENGVHVNALVISMVNKYPIVICNKKLAIGCMVLTIEEWKEKYDAGDFEAEMMEKSINEYKEIIEQVKHLIDII